MTPGRSGDAAGLRSVTPQAVFRRLRVRLSVTFFLVALLGFGALVGVLTHRDAVADARRADDLLQGAAARAAALVYLGPDGRPTGEALEGDNVTTTTPGLLVVERQGEGYRTVFSSGMPVDADWEAFAARCIADAAEAGSHDDLGATRVAGMPWWAGADDPNPSGCAVAVARRDGLAQSDVALPAILGSGLLLALLTGLVWWAAGRSLDVAEEALGDRERFLATAAHEMRGPLARMRAGAEAALHDDPPPAPHIAARLRGLVASADGAGRIVSNILLASRIDHAEVPVRREAVRLDAVAVEVETTIDGLVVDVTEPVEVVGDAMLLRQALTNLVDNAQRHGRSGERAATVVLTVERRADGVVARVADDGPGFPAGIDVWSPYVSGATGGTGLGLPLVRWIAERHGVTVWIGAAGGRDGLDGAAVELRFPPERPAGETAGGVLSSGPSTRPSPIS